MLLLILDILLALQKSEPAPGKKFPEPPQNRMAPKPCCSPSEADNNNCPVILCFSLKDKRTRLLHL